MSKRKGISKTWQYIGVAILAVVAITAAIGVLNRPAPVASPGSQEQFLPAPTTTTPEPSQTPDAVTVERTEGEPLNVLFAGDSLTGGLSASVQTNGFKWLMLEELEETGPVQEFNSALSGGTTLEVSEQYEVPDNLDLAVVELGTNDRAQRTPLDEFQAAYDSLLDRIVEGSRGVGLVCAGVWQAGGGGPAQPEYENIIEESCTGHGGVFVPLEPIYDDPEEVIGPAGLPAFGGTSDDFHPNDTGHERIAEALLDAIKIK